MPRSELTLKSGDPNPSTPVPRPTRSAYDTSFGDDNNKWWPEDQLLRISFLNGSAKQRKKVRDIAPEWFCYAASLDYEFVDHIHGEIRIAFDDAQIKKPRCNVEDAPLSHMSWSYIGTDNLGALNTPETMHLSDIEDTDDVSKYEKTIILHEFGHALGLEFAPYQAPPGQCLPDSTWLSYVAGVISQPDHFNWPLPAVENTLNNCPTDPELGPDSIMAFGWINEEISESDKLKVAKHYPVRAKTLTFGVQNRYDKSLTHYPNDLELYVLSENNILYQAIREVVKSSTKDKNYNSRWVGWHKIRKDVPPDANRLLILDHPDRLEVYAVNDSGHVLYFDFRHKDKGDSWFYRDDTKHPADWFQWGKSVTRLRAAEVEGGYEVIFIDCSGKHEKLGHIFRKQGDEKLPADYHPITGQDIKVLTSARSGFGNKLFAASDNKIYNIARKGQQWILDGEDAPSDLDRIADNGATIERLAAGQSGTVLHYLVITNDGVLSHNTKKEGGWVSWDSSDTADGSRGSFINAAAYGAGYGSSTDTSASTGAVYGSRAQAGDDTVKNAKTSAILIDVSAGVAFSDDTEDDYLQAFALDINGCLYFNRLGNDGEWKFDDQWNATFDDSDNSFKLARNVRHPPTGTDLTKTSIKSFPTSIFTKSAKCGDLEAFFIASGEDDTDEDKKNNVNTRGIIYRNELHHAWNKEWKPYYWW